MSTYEKLDHNRIKLEVHVSAEKFDEGLNKAYIKESKRYNLPGFRKGKAPRQMIEKAYGEGVFYEGAFDAVYVEAYLGALTEAGLEPVDAPDIDIQQIGRGQELIFTATFPVKPEIVLSADMYKGIELEKREYNVTDEQINREIEREQQRLVRYVDASRPIEMGDRIVLDYSGAIDGVKFDGGTAEGQTLDIGSGQFVPGFEEQLVGVNAGEEKDITVTFPENYHGDLGGKVAVFHCAVKDVKAKELPALDDDFAKDVSDFDTLEEYKADIRAKLEEDAKRRAQAALENAAVGAVVEKLEIDVPQGMVERQIDEMIHELQQSMARQNIRLEDYARIMGMSMEDLRKNYSVGALQRVKGDLVLEEIVKQENIVATDEDVQAEFEAFAKSMDKEIEDIKELMETANIEAIKRDLAMRKAVELIVDNAVMVDPKPAGEPDKAEAAPEETAE